MQKNYKLPVFNGKLLKKAYAVNPLSQYVVSDKIPFTVESLKNNSFYLDLSFAEDTKRTDIYLKQGHTIEVIAIDWLKGGVPRLLTKHGYITAHKDWVKNVDGIIVSKVSAYSAHTNAVDQDAIAKGENPSDKKTKAKRSRKFNKFARDPYAFFRDSKKPSISMLRHVFNENHMIGRYMCRLVRKRFNHK
ncbi:DUF5776 domain-containing protein [Neisseria subflava]|uniref:DUF5776 domain-containing protein n=1 Tax=Neisseria subflava TaxID=28449 RepID=UPI003305FDF0